MSGSCGIDVIAEARRQWTKHWGSGPTPSMALATSIMRVQQILLSRLNELLKPFDLTFPRYEALMLLYLSRRGSLPLGKIGERLQVHPTSVTNLIDGLEAAGLAERVPHERDRRTTLAAITPRGREVARSATEILNAELFGTAPLQLEELEQVSDVLRRLRAHADEFPES
ncbi:MAG: MarR family transcriptional regulator [Thermoleophilaceae bacterium]